MYFSDNEELQTPVMGNDLLKKQIQYEIEMKYLEDIEHHEGR